MHWSNSRPDLGQPRTERGFFKSRQIQNDILNYRLRALPGLIVDGRVVLTGSPPRHKLEKTLREAFEGTTACYTS